MVVMITDAQITELIKQVKTASKERKFKQSIELIINFKDIDVKKGFALNEIVQLPKTSSPATVCVIATGDMSQKAKEAKADSVIGTEELDKFATNKRESRKFINKYDFFLADTKVMPLVGKTLGQLLGPRGKMPTPVPFDAPIESFLARFRTSIKVRTRASLSISCKIGDESMEDSDLAINAHTVLSAIEKKLPNGEKNIKKIMIKTTMSKPIKQVQEIKKKHAR
jgi:large subunit ribosomal protein L1